MKNLTAKEIEHIIGCDGIIFGSGNNPTYTTNQRIKMIKEYAKTKCKETIELCAMTDGTYIYEEDGHTYIRIEDVENTELPELK